MDVFSEDKGYVSKFNRTLQNIGRARSKGITKTDRKKRAELHGRIEETRAAADQRHKDWDANRYYAEGEGQIEKYVEGMPKDLQAEFTCVNFIRGIVDHFVAALTGGIGDWYVVSEMGGQDEQALGLQRYLEAVRHRLNLATLQRKIGRDAFLMGTGVLKAGWNTQTKQASCDYIDPLTLFPEANAKKPEQAYFIAERHVFNADYVERLYPGIDMKEASDAGPTALDDDSERWVTRQIEVWEVLYEFGAKMMIYTGDQVLYVGDAPFPSAYPYHFFRIYDDPKSLWGIPLLKDIQPLQDFYNKFMTRLSIYQHLCINPVGYTDDPVAKQNWDTTPGAVIEHRVGSTLGYLDPPQIPSELFAIGHTVKADLDTVSAITEILRGERPGKSTPSGIAVDLLGERADRRIMGPGQEWSHGWAALGQMLLDIIERYTVDSATLPVAQLGGAGIAKVDRESLGWNPGFAGEDPTRYYVVAQPGAQIPLSPAAIAEQAFQAIAAGALDAEGLLRAMHFPGTDDYLDRQKALEQAAIQGQQQGMMAAGGGAPTGPQAMQ